MPERSDHINPRSDSEDPVWRQLNQELMGDLGNPWQADTQALVNWVSRLHRALAVLIDRAKQSGAITPDDVKSILFTVNTGQFENESPPD